MARFIDISGNKYGRITVIRHVGKNKHGQTTFEGVCDCGKNIPAISKQQLVTGNTRSCGCLANELTATRNYRHGKAATPIYRIWLGMQERCNKKGSDFYHLYGGRGIKCEWQSFQDFYRDMGDEFNKNYTGPRSISIERVDNNGNYSKENCIWADYITQQNNRRNNHVLEYNGKRQTLTQWAREVGFDSSTIRQRLNLGFSVEEALTIPKYGKR